MKVQNLIYICILYILKYQFKRSSRTPFYKKKTLIFLQNQSMISYIISHPYPIYSHNSVLLVVALATNLCLFLPQLHIEF
jgi:hypothetical protein